MNKRRHSFGGLLHEVEAGERAGTDVIVDDACREIARQASCDSLRDERALVTAAQKLLLVLRQRAEAVRWANNLGYPRLAAVTGWGDVNIMERGKITCSTLERTGEMVWLERGEINDIGAMLHWICMREELPEVQAFCAHYSVTDSEIPQSATFVANLLMHRRVATLKWLRQTFESQRTMLDKFVSYDLNLVASAALLIQQTSEDCDWIWAVLDARGGIEVAMANTDIYDFLKFAILKVSLSKMQWLFARFPRLGAMDILATSTQKGLFYQETLLEVACSSGFARKVRWILEIFEHATPRDALENMCRCAWIRGERASNKRVRTQGLTEKEAQVARYKAEKRSEGIRRTKEVLDEFFPPAVSALE